MTIYFNNAVDQSLTEAGNYWLDAACTIAAGTTPDWSVDEVHVVSGATAGVPFGGMSIGAGGSLIFESESKMGDGGLVPDDLETWYVREGKTYAGGTRVGIATIPFFDFTAPAALSSGGESWQDLPRLTGGGGVQHSAYAWDDDAAYWFGAGNNPGYKLYWTNISGTDRWVIEADDGVTQWIGPASYDEPRGDYVGPDVVTLRWESGTYSPSPGTVQYVDLGGSLL